MAFEETRTPEEESAGNRRALLGCGAILLVLGLLCGGGYWSIRGVLGAETGEACHGSMDCRWGHYCARALGEAEPRCLLSCDEDAECPSRRCVSVRVDGSQSNQSVCAP